MSWTAAPAAEVTTAMRLRIGRQGLFVGRVKEALLPQLLLQLLEGHRQVPHPLRGQGVAVELIGPVPGKHA